MAKFFTALFLTVFVSACSSFPKPDSSKSQLINVFDSRNKIVASVDRDSGDVTYYAPPDEAFRALYFAYLRFAEAVEKEKQASQKVSEKSQKVVKKPNPKKEE